MKKTPIVTLLVSAALLGACGCASDSTGKSSEPAQPKPAKDTRPKEDRLKVGMTKDEVRSALGDPRGTANNSDGSETWTYNDSEMAFIPFYTLSGGKFHNILVIFGADGKVKSWSTNTSSGY